MKINAFRIWFSLFNIFYLVAILSFVGLSILSVSAVVAQKAKTADTLFISGLDSTSVPSINNISTNTVELLINKMNNPLMYAVLGCVTLVVVNLFSTFLILTRMFRFVRLSQQNFTKDLTEMIKQCWLCPFRNDLRITKDSQSIDLNS